MTVSLLGFNNDRAGRMASLIHGWRCGAQPANCLGFVLWWPPPCAFAVRRAAAGVVWRVSRGRVAPLLLSVPAFSPCRVRDHAPSGARGARRAPLKPFSRESCHRPKRQRKGNEKRQREKATRKGNEPVTRACPFVLRRVMRDTRPPDLRQSKARIAADADVHPKGAAA